MAKVLEQGLSPVGPMIDQFIPSNVVNDLKGIKLGNLSLYFSNFLNKNKNNFLLENDQYNNPYIVDMIGARIAITIAIIKGNKVCIYTRDSSEPNLNNDIDIIGSFGYSIPSLRYKISDKMLELIIKEVTLAKQYAWEITDGIGDKKLVKMPIILLELEENPMYSIHFSEIQNHTAKMQAVINELS